MEIESIKLFNEFVDFVKSRPSEPPIIMTGSDSINKALHLDSIEHAVKVRDTAFKKYILKNYIAPPYQRTHYFGAQPDSTESPGYLYRRFEYELGFLFRLLRAMTDSGQLSNLKIVPLRLYKDHFVYNHLNKWERDYSFVFYDKLKPEEPIGFVMFLPGEVLADKARPKILGWTLMFRANQFYFMDAFGVEGSGIKRLFSY